MSAAFDLLDKEILLPSMIKLGIPINLCKIYEEFLSNRKAYVQCDQAKSDIFDVPIGCVQGSPSGPYLFTLLVDGISEYMPDTNIVAYADDMYFIYEADTWDEVATLASESTKTAIEWLKKSGMVINSSKTEAAYFANNKIAEPPKITIDDAIIEVKHRLCVLGIIFDHNMSWESHIETVLTEARSRIQALRHVRQHLTKQESINVAHGLFFGKFYYCSSVWLTPLLSKELLKKLTVASNSCLRAALGYKINDISTSDLHKEADILTPYQRCFQDMAIMFWKIIKNCEPKNIFFDLLTQGEHKSRLSHYYFKQSSSSEVRKHAFVNRLNDSIPLLGDTFLDLSEYAMKKFVKKIVIENIPAKVPEN
jgi:hypothetical protein